MSIKIGEEFKLGVDLQPQQKLDIIVNALNLRSENDQGQHDNEIARALNLYDGDPVLRDLWLSRDGSYLLTLSRFNPRDSSPVTGEFHCWAGIPKGFRPGHFEGEDKILLFEIKGEYNEVMELIKPFVTNGHNCFGKRNCMWMKSI